jgi:hypothetical protein
MQLLLYRLFSWQPFRLSDAVSLDHQPLEAGLAEWQLSL